MWIVERKGFTEGLADQSDLAANQISQGRKVKAGPKQWFQVTPVAADKLMPQPL